MISNVPSTKPFPFTRNSNSNCTWSPVGYTADLNSTAGIRNPRGKSVQFAATPVPEASHRSYSVPDNTRGTSELHPTPVSDVPDNANLERQRRREAREDRRRHRRAYADTESETAPSSQDDGNQRRRLEQHRSKPSQARTARGAKDAARKKRDHTGQPLSHSAHGVDGPSSLPTNDAPPHRRRRSSNRGHGDKREAGRDNGGVAGVDARPPTAESDETEELPPRFDDDGRRKPERGEDPLADKLQDMLAGKVSAGGVFRKLAGDILSGGR